MLSVKTKLDEEVLTDAPSSFSSVDFNSAYSPAPRPIQHQNSHLWQNYSRRALTPYPNATQRNSITFFPPFDMDFNRSRSAMQLTTISTDQNSPPVSPFLRQEPESYEFQELKSDEKGSEKKLISRRKSSALELKSPIANFFRRNSAISIGSKQSSIMSPDSMDEDASFMVKSYRRNLSLNNEDVFLCSCSSMFLRRTDLMRHIQASKLGGRDCDAQVIEKDM